MISGSFAKRVTEGLIVRWVAVAARSLFAGGSVRECGGLTAMLGSIAK